MVHGDDKGLVLPPKVAKTKAVVVPIIFEKDKEKVLKKAEEIGNKLKDVGVYVDSREYSAGWKFNEWELKGVPLRIEVGPKDIEKKQVVVVRRDTGKKEIVPESDVKKKVEELLEKMQKEIFAKAKEFLDSNIESAKSMDELKKKLEKRKVVKVYFEDSPEVEEEIKAVTGGATSRIVEDSAKAGKCVFPEERRRLLVISLKVTKSF
jgi:prolyl-tRNA synthetase